MTEPTNDRISELLADVDFPADKDTLVAAAKATGASDEEARALRAIPPVTYENIDQVLASVDTADQHPQAPSEEGAQARERDKRGVAEHQRLT
jgi:ribosomal protein L12E/L44/L45/RPP1/RPP2